MEQREIQNTLSYGFQGARGGLRKDLTTAGRKVLSGSGSDLLQSPVGVGSTHDAEEGLFRPLM